MPGYRLAHVDKIKLPAKFICSHCKELLRDAVQTCCGHFYCESCLEQLSENATTSFSCVKDGNVISNLKEQTFKDKFMRREVLALTVCCTFQNEGCIWSGKVQHFEEHLRTCHNHLHCERVNNLRDVVDGILHTQENLKGGQRHLQDQQRHLQDVLQNVIQQLQERRIKSVDHPLALRNVTLADLEECVRQQEFSSYDGLLLWKISDYARRRNDAVTGQVSLYSPCFYTSRHGYKMCARLYLNGDGMGRGTHISVFFVVMRGEYDALLRWPFRQKVTFMLLDQDNVKHVIDAFRPDPSSSSFQRPRREANIASGCPMFCSLAELNNHAYVRDDTMFLKIIVDTSDL